ncbi:uncharacterized protein HGUI_00520 [Hanseniaspora guilliermondii]|uniref:Uncharacterized protein n=1 Tax=Hanseniaspora guilliermondii TaxID=56406 RepID=A0A1L0AW34_9ASCO|nr:uncharacterized protein HGUI_00520 [Hanseniaspora guilliermondii]
MLSIRSKLLSFNTKPLIFNQFRLASTLPNIKAAPAVSSVKPIDGDELKEQIIRETSAASANLELAKYAIHVQFKKHNIKVCFSEYFIDTTKIPITDNLDYHRLIKESIKPIHRLRFKTSIGSIGFNNSAKREPEAVNILCRYVSNKIAAYLKTGDLLELKKSITKSKSGKFVNDGGYINESPVIKKKAPLYFSFKGTSKNKRVFMDALLGPEGEQLVPYIDVVFDKTARKHGGNKGKSVRRV